MVAYFPQTKNIWCAPIRHSSYPQKREITHIFPKKSSFCPIFCKLLIFRGLGMCLLGARQLFAPGETLIWYSSFLRQKIFGVHPSGTPPSPCLPKNGPFLAKNTQKMCLMGARQNFFRFEAKPYPLCTSCIKIIRIGSKLRKIYIFLGGLGLLTKLLKDAVL